MVICYLFLGGAGAGALFFVAVMQLRSPDACRVFGPARTFVPDGRYAGFFARGYLAALIALGVGALFLLFDLGRIDRALTLFSLPTSSFLTFGSFALAISLASAALLALAWLERRLHLGSAFVSAVAVLATIAAVGVMVYTGFLLMSIGGAIPLWGSPLVPLLFTLSALSTGIAVLLGTCVLSGLEPRFRTTVDGLVRIDTGLLIIELAAALVFLALTDSAAASGAAAMQLPQALYLGGFVVVGLVFPLVTEILHARRRRPWLPLAAGIALLIGGFCLRYAVVSAGMWVAVTSVASASPVVMI